MADATVPAFLDHLTQYRGLPVPYVTGVEHGVPNFEAADIDRWCEAVFHKRCGLCGLPLKYWVYFCASLGAGLNRKLFDPPLHLECAQYIFNNPSYAKLIGKNPEELVIYQTRSYKARYNKDRNGRVTFWIEPAPYTEIYRVPERAEDAGITV